VGERVLGVLLHAGRQGKHIVFGSSCRGRHFHHFGLAERQRAGLVEDHDVQVCGVFERRGVLDQDAVLRAAAGADHDRHRGRKTKRVGARDDEHRDR